MPMDDMSHFESCDMDFANSPQLVAQIVALNFASNMCENTVAYAFADIERFAIPRIDKTIDICLQALGNFDRKFLCRVMA